MPSSSGVITFTTDFGAGWYVGAMKGAALRVNPGATLVDLTHGVSPMNVLEGAFSLAAACSAFPEGAVHVAVIDPGVGTTRRALVIETDRYFFVGPDNGVLTLAAPPPLCRRAFAIENARFFGPERSATFHGRDIFSPVAAHLASGADPAEMGPPAGEPVALGLPEVVCEGEDRLGEIVLRDAFGNLITNIPGDSLKGRSQMEVWLEDRKIGPLRSSYGEVAAGEALALIGSHGYLEIAVSGGSAGRSLGEGPGGKVRVK